MLYNKKHKRPLCARQQQERMGIASSKTTENEITIVKSYYPSLVQRYGRQIWGSDWPSADTVLETINSTYAVSGDGKSASQYYVSEKYYIKTLTSSDYKTLILPSKKTQTSLLQRYFEYTSKVSGVSLLPRIYGVYKLSNGQRVMVMHNLQSNKSADFKAYDLKGSVAKRRVDDEDSGTTLKDNNFRGKRVLFTQTDDYVKFLKTIQSDVAFLAKEGLMDYSLYCGIDTRKVDASCIEIKMLTNPLDDQDYDDVPTLYMRIGIIDILQLFDTRKKIEALYKGGLKQHADTSTVPPAEYSRRFLAFMTQHFVSKWDLFFSPNFCDYDKGACIATPSCIWDKQGESCSMLMSETKD